MFSNLGGACTELTPQLKGEKTGTLKVLCSLRPSSGDVSLSLALSIATVVSLVATADSAMVSVDPESVVIVAAVVVSLFVTISEVSSIYPDSVEGAISPFVTVSKVGSMDIDSVDVVMLFVAVSVVGSLDP